MVAGVANVANRETEPLETTLFFASTVSGYIITILVLVFNTITTLHNLVWNANLDVCAELWLGYRMRFPEHPTPPKYKEIPARNLAFPYTQASPLQQSVRTLRACVHF